MATTLETDALRMAQSLHHRGPDGAGIWVDAPAGIALGHRRLAIIDLTDAARAAQATSSDGRHVLDVHGGTLQLRPAPSSAQPDRRAVPWHRRHRSTAGGNREHGPRADPCPCRRGSASALGPPPSGASPVSRIGLGEKPLYDGVFGSLGPSGSELKVFRTRLAPSRTSTETTHRVHAPEDVPAPMSIYANVHKLLPGATVSIPARERPAPAPGLLLGAAPVPRRRYHRGPPRDRRSGGPPPSRRRTGAELRRRTRGRLPVRRDRLVDSDRGQFPGRGERPCEVFHRRLRRTDLRRGDRSRRNSRPPGDGSHQCAP